MSPLTRRTLLAGGMTLPLVFSEPAGRAVEPDQPTELRWLDGGAPAEMTGVTWGCLGQKASCQQVSRSA